MADLIYLIEDDESIRELVKMVLETFGFQVAYFETAEEALEASLERLPSFTSSTLCFREWTESAR